MSILVNKTYPDMISSTDSTVYYYYQFVAVVVVAVELSLVEVFDVNLIGS